MDVIDADSGSASPRRICVYHPPRLGAHRTL